MKRTIITLLLLLAIFTCSFEALSLPAVSNKSGTDGIQRTPAGVFDLQKNTASNVEFYTTNSGIFGYNTQETVGGLYWPRGADNQYIFASGIWFGAKKRLNPDGSLKTLCTITYNPNNGMNSHVPGRIEDGNNLDSSKINDYRIYFSTDFNKSTGKAYNSQDGPDWPIWDTSPTETLNNNGYFGNYIIDPTNRNKNVYPKGPAIISDEDIHYFQRD